MTDDGRSLTGRACVPDGAEPQASQAKPLVPIADDGPVLCSYRQVYDLMAAAGDYARTEQSRCSKNGNRDGETFYHGYGTAFGMISEAFEALQVTGSFADSDLAQGIDARSGQTEGLDPKGESPVANGDAP